MQTRHRVAIWLLVVAGAVFGVLVAMLLVYVVLGGSVGVGH